MNRSLVLSILSEDKPGVVESLASVVSDHQGNWLESRMTHLAGKFAGILQVSVPESQLAALQQALQQLQTQGIMVISAEVNEASDSEPEVALQFNLVGNDRPGIIKELSQTFSAHHINVDELHTGCTSMPWSGDPMFTAQGVIHIPEGVDLDELTDTLNEIADELGVDIELEEAENDLAE